MKPLLNIKGKKSGIVGSTLSNFWSYVIFVFVVIIFFIFFQVQTNEIKKNSILSLESDTNLEVPLLSFLRTPVTCSIFGVDIAEVKVAADCIIDSIAITIIAPGGGVTNPLSPKIKSTIDDILSDHPLHNKNPRLMIKIDDDTCAYDTMDFGCKRLKLGETPSQGLVTLPFTIGNDLRFVNIILQ